MSRLGLLLALAILSVHSLDASTVAPPTFDKLVSDSETIVYAEVIDRVTRWERRGTRNVIVTDVTLRVRDVLKGRANAVQTIHVLGGTVGDVTQRVAGAPLFLVGDRDVLFLRKGDGGVSPVMGLFHGRFRVVEGHNGVGEYIANYARQPVSSIRDFAQPQKLAAGQMPVTLNEFLRVVRASVGR
jgi:hypothetical protein